MLDALVRTGRLIATHPLTRDRKLEALARVARWQLESRLRSEVVVPWIAGTRLAVQRGMHGATERAMTGCRPVSLFSVQTVRQLGNELGTTLDKRRFRANVCLDLGSGAGFAEDGLVGPTLRLGPKVVIAILERDPRCKMITIDPDTTEPSGAILRKVSRAHDGMAGVYGAVLVEGTAHRGDDVELLS